MSNISIRLREREVCQILCCSKSHLYRLHKQGRLLRRKEGYKFTYWLRKEVEAYAMGINPYPAAAYPTDAYSVDIKNDFRDDEAEPRQVCIAGRMMSRRVMGKASFMEIQDSRGRIQVYVTRDDVCPGDDKDLYNVVFKRLLDLGDFVGVKGFVFRTQTGEISVHAKELTVLAKSIRPLPVVKQKDGVTYDSFDDPELRYRQRYVDLIVNAGVKETFIKRSKVFKSMREFFDKDGYMEVETPVLQPIPGGASARPFITHHNTLDVDLYLRIATELYLKRLIVGGFEGVYEIGKNFRNEGMDKNHNPEFTCMELYVSYKDYYFLRVQSPLPSRHHARRHQGEDRLRPERQDGGRSPRHLQGA